MKELDARLTKQHLSTKIFKTYFKYIEKFHPEVDVEKICEESGLPYSYFLDESNWVSIDFDERFLLAIKKYISDPDFEFKVGQFSISKEGLGSALYAIGRSALSLSNIYNNSWKLSEFWNHALKFELVESRTGSVQLKLTPNMAALSQEEFQTVVRIFPDIIANTSGYYASAPLLKGYPPAIIRVEKKSDCEYILEAKYKAEVSTHKKIINGNLLITALHIAALFSDLPKLDVILSAIGLSSLYTGIMFYIENNKLKGLADDTQRALSKIDEQYKSLVDTKIHLQRKLREAEAINKITDRLIQTTSEEGILNAACEDLTKILEFDRTMILLASEDEKVLEFRGGYINDELLMLKIQQIKFDIDIESSDPTKVSNVYRNRKSILVEDVKAHIGTLNAESQMVLSASGSKSFVCVPITSESKTLGVLFADNYKSDRKLNIDDVNLLEVIGHQIAISVEKHRAQNEAVEAYIELDVLAKSYSRFVPWETIKLLGYDKVTDVSMQAGKELNIGIVFCDIRGFTTMSEKMTPAESITFLNSYFSNLAPIFQKHDGIIDKFLGDGIMALFVDVNKALDAMREFQLKLNEYNNIHRSGGSRAFIKAGMGLHYGKVLLGAVGFKERLSISVVSDAVNLASRLDGLTKKFKVECVCTDDVLAQVPNPKAIRLIAQMRVQGRESLTNVYEVFSHFEGAAITHRELYRSQFEEAVKAYGRGEFAEAKEIFSEIKQFCGNDTVVDHYLAELNRASRSRKAA